MAIFSRRTIQRLINENATFVSRKQTKDHVRKLNLHNESVLDTEWEIVLLNALSKFGRVEHEPTWSGPRPDIFFTSLSRPTESFIADIVTVSDRGIDEQFPVNALFKEVVRVAKEHGLRENSFAMKIGHRDEDREDIDEEQKARLPGTARFHETILNDKFHNFIRDIAESSNELRKFLINYEDTDVLITYDPAQGFAIVTYPHYKEPSSLTRNTVYSRSSRLRNAITYSSTLLRMGGSGSGTTISLNSSNRVSSIVNLLLLTNSVMTGRKGMTLAARSLRSSGSGGGRRPSRLKSILR